MTPYGVSVRYPNELFLEERHVKEALDNLKSGRMYMGSYESIVMDL